MNGLDYSLHVYRTFIEKMLKEDTWITFTETLLKIILVLVLSKVIIKIAKKTICKVFLMRSKSPLRINERREATILKLLENIITYIVYFISAVMILEYCGLSVKGLLAGPVFLD